MKCKYDYCQNEVNESKSNAKKIFCSDNCKTKYHVDKKRWQLKLKAIQYKGGKCEICGYNKCPTSLEFHHVNPKLKEFSISVPHSRSWEKIKNEIDKCQLLCSNCHKEEEFKKSSQHKSFLSNLMKEYGFVTQLV